MKMKSTARLAFKYAGVLVNPQQEFSVKSGDVKVLKALGRAIEAPVVVKKAAVEKPAEKAVEKEGEPGYKRRDIGSFFGKAEKNDDEDKSKRTYKRRDMKAE
jgi:hypothetical protein